MKKTQLNFSDRFPAAQEGSVKKMYGRVALFCGLVEKLELYIPYVTYSGSLFKILNKKI